MTTQFKNPQTLLSTGAWFCVQTSGAKFPANFSSAQKFISAYTYRLCRNNALKIVN